MRSVVRVLLSGLFLICFFAIGQSNDDPVPELVKKIDKSSGATKLTYMVELAGAYQTANNIGEGIILTNEAINLAVELADSNAEAELKLVRGTLNVDLLHYDSALVDYNWVIDLARRESNSDLLARSLTKAGVYYGLTDRYDLAEQYMSEANKLHKALGNNLEISTNYNNLAVAITGEVKKLLQEKYYTYCQSSEKRSDIQTLIAEQLKYYQKSMELAEGDAYSIAIAELNIAISSYCEAGDFEASNSLFNSVLKVFQEIGASNFEFFTLISQAQVYFYEGRYEDAAILFDQAEALAAVFDAPFIWVLLYEYWLPQLIKTNDTDKALDVLYKLYHLKQLEHDQKSKARSENAQVLHEVGQKEQSIAKLSFENELQSNEIERERIANQFQRVVIGLVVLLLVILAFFLKARIKSEKLTKEHNALLKKMASTDSLTGLKNRRALSEIIDREMGIYKRHQTPFTITLIDVDHFKEVNDKYGHNAGDNVLKELASIIESNIREIDIACRWGGEEFLVLFPQASIEEVKPVLERIKAKVEGFLFDDNAGQFNVSFTAGVAQIRADLSWTELCHNADSALYSGKKSGRAKVVESVA